MSFTSEFSKIKSAGSAKSGVKHWWAQRFTAICLIFLLASLIYNVICKISESGNLLVEDLIKTPIQTIALLAFVLVAVHHANLGIQVVLEDYVTCKAKRMTMLIITKLVSYASVFAAIFAVIDCYFS